MQLRLSFILLLLLFINHFCWLTGQNTELVIQKVDISDHFNSASIQNISQDNKGFIWFHTSSGLFRHDGYVTEKFILKDTGNIIITDKIRAVYFQEDTALWVCNAKNLIKINLCAKSFISFPDTIKDIKSVRFITLAPNGILWIVKHNGLTWFDTRQNKMIEIPKYIFNRYHRDVSIYSILFTNDSSCWIGSSNGIDKLNLSTNKLKVIIHYIGTITDLESDKEGNIWASGFDKNLIKVNSEQKIIRKSLSSLKSAGFKSMGVQTIIKDDITNTFWIGMYFDGIYHFDPKSGNILSHHNHETFTYNSLPSNQINALFIDQNHNLWISSKNGGISKASLSGNPFRNLYPIPFKQNSIPEKSVSSVFIDSKGNTWIGTNKGVSKIDAQTGNYTHYYHSTNNSMADATTCGICEDLEGNIWWCSWEGNISRLNTQSGSIKKFKGGHNDATGWSFRNMKVDDEGNVWIISHDKGLEVYDRKTETFIYYPYPFKNLNPQMLHIENGSIITGGDGFFAVFDKNKKQYTSVNTAEPFVHMLITSYIKDSSNNKFYSAKNLFYSIGSSNKVNQVYDERIRDINILSLYLDKNNRMWMCTEKGLYTFVPTFENDTLIITGLHKYIEADGLISSSFKHNASFQNTNTGEIWLGTKSGLISFQPENITFDTTQPTIAFTKLKVNNRVVKVNETINSNLILTKDIAYTQSITLNYKQNHFSIEFAALHYTRPVKNMYAWKLEGYDKDWVWGKQQREVSYMNLKPGDYTLRVKASNHDGCWNNEGISLHITITPPWWQTWWFKTLVIIFIVFLLLSIYFIRVNILKKRQKELETIVKKRTMEVEYQKQELEVLNEELVSQSEELMATNETLHELNTTKDKFFSIIAHDLKNPFHAINGFASMLINRFDKLEENIKLDIVNTIHDSSKSASALLENLLQWARTQTKGINYTPEQINLSQLVNETISFQKVQATEKNIKLNVNSTGNEFAYADNNMITTVVRNLLNNAIKFTGINGTIEIGIENTETHACFTIKDSGVGMSQSQVDKLFRIDRQISTRGTGGEKGTGLGLIICKEFIESCNGRISVESEPGKGSVFTIILPQQANIAVSPAEIKIPDAANNSDDKDSSIDTAILKDKLALIVEDNDDIRKNSSNYISQFCSVVEAEDGKIGLEKATELIPDIIVSDLMMPQLDGFELCDKIKQNPVTCHIPFLLLTAKFADESRITGYNKGADDYLVKPFNNEALLARIINIINTRNELQKQFYHKFLNKDINKDILTNPDEKFLQQVIQTINKNIDNTELSVEELSKGHSLSRTQLYRKIQGTTGKSPSDLIRTVRLQNAVSLLKTSSLTISEIMYQCGFNNSSHFARCFKKAFGVLPSEYQKKNL